MNNIKKNIDRVVPIKGLFKQSGYFLNKLLHDIVGKMTNIQNNLNRFVNDTINNIDNLFNEIFRINGVLSHSGVDIEYIQKNLYNISKPYSISIDFSFDASQLDAKSGYIIRPGLYTSDFALFLNGIPTMNCYKMSGTQEKLSHRLVANNTYVICVPSQDNLRELLKPSYDNETLLLFQSLKADVILPNNITVLPQMFACRAFITSINLENIKRLEDSCLAVNRLTEVALSKDIEYIGILSLCNNDIQKIIVPKLIAPEAHRYAFGYSNTGLYAAYAGKNGKLIVPTGASGYSGGGWDVLLDPNKCNFTIEYSDELLEEINNTQSEQDKCCEWEYVTE